MTHLGDRAALEGIVGRIQAVSPEARAHWGRMNSHGMLCHLADSFQLPLGERTASVTGGLFHRTVMKWGALYAPMEWPHGVPTRPEMEQGVGGSAPVEFAADRKRLAEIVRRFADPGCSFEGRLHPIFGTLTRKQWLRWGYLHADHHLRQFGV